MTAAFNHPLALPLTWTVTNDQSARADVHLVLRIPRLSRTRARSIIESGDLRRGREILKPSSRLRAGDEIVLWRIPPDSPKDAPSDIPIVFENQELLIVDKPAGLAMHPSARYLYATLTQWLKSRTEKANPCHRLDRETSGLVVCAKTKETERQIKMGFEAHAHQKTYVAIAKGKVNESECTEAIAPQKSRGLVRIRMVASPKGLAAETRFKTLAYDDERDRSLVICRPLSGRQHQIRAHLSLLAHPIVGDKLYQMGDTFFDAFTKRQADLTSLEHHRHALHAAAIVLKSGAQFTCKVPEDLCALMPNTNVNALVESHTLRSK